MYHNTTQNVSTWILHQLSIDMKLPRLVLSMTMYHKNPKECNRKCSVAYQLLHVKNMEEWGIYISMYTNNMTDCNTYSKCSMVQKLDKPSSILHHLHINHTISVHDMTNIIQYVNSVVCRNSEKNCGFF